jgi:hypothetical protein
MMNAAGPRTGGEITAPIPPADRIAPDDSRSWPAFLQHRVGDRSQGDGRRDARAGDRAQEERGDGHRARGAGGLATGQREREIDVELAGAGVVEDRAVDREQDDESGRDQQRLPQHSLGAEVLVRDDVIEILWRAAEWTGHEIREVRVRDRDEPEQR